MKKWIAIQNDSSTLKWYSNLVFSADNLEDAIIQYKEFLRRNNISEPINPRFEEYKNPYETKE